MKDLDLILVQRGKRLLYSVRDISLWHRRRIVLSLLCLIIMTKNMFLNHCSYYRLKKIRQLYIFTVLIWEIASLYKSILFNPKRHDSCLALCLKNTSKQCFRKKILLDKSVTKTYTHLKKEFGERLCDVYLYHWQKYFCVCKEGLGWVKGL